MFIHIGVLLGCWYERRLKEIIDSDENGRLLVYPPEKFPVRTESGEYKVEVGSRYIGLGYGLRCTVFVENLNRSIFKPRKFIKVDRVTVSDERYEEFIEDLVGFAIKVVKRYEENNRKEIAHYKAVEKSLEEFEKWNGVIGG